jgi:molybdopterin synthase catalytic subunit
MKIISVAGRKKSGKTKLAERLIHKLEHHGSVGTVKHVHDDDLNPEHTDTRRHLDAGAEVAVAVTPYGTAKFSTCTKATLDNALNELANSGMDYAIVEGFKHSQLPKIVLGELELPNTVRTIPDDPAALSDEAITDLINIIEQQSDFHTLDSLMAQVRRNPFVARAGAIGSFTGIVRQNTGDVETKGLEFESYEARASDMILRIVTDLKEREGVLDVKIHHKSGWIEPGNDIVYIVVAASHRQQLFSALSDAIERVKSDVPIWKKEHTITGQFWVHDRP